MHGFPVVTDPLSHPGDNLKPVGAEVFLVITDDSGLCPLSPDTHFPNLKLTLISPSSATMTS
jgi:hypothetical protein